MRTKPYQRFIARVADYEADIELSDVLVTTFISKVKNSNHNIATHMGLSNQLYPKLASRINSHQSRKIVGIHLQKALYGSFMKDLYEDFSEFLQETIKAAAMKGIDYPRLLSGSSVDMKMIDVLKAGSWDALLIKVSENVFRSLENERSTIKLIEKFNIKLDLKIQQNFVDEAMPYLEARHIIVHRDGKADAKYIADYAAIALDPKGKIKLDFAFVTLARTKVCELARHINERVQAEDLCLASEIVQ
ncbi:hypothetical protein HB780_14685 [Rhizobium lusitanum]|uniref:hypothetical protein n=1 Tax=Rhizobium lusitanum TaxID=293958 RepID=UPI00160BB0B4|nr:hypothetical protein [Rhizobium lusitanum]QND46981.1 hypothetical protein HB780_14685 [Rhizobium lusitanum]